jgi:hypothetical protein
MIDEIAVEKKNCTDCVHALLQDHGYSNYTVEGTDFSCKLDLHPDGTFDRWYGEDSRLLYAEKCPSFMEGEVEFHNVDCPHDCSCEGTQYENKRDDS